MVGKICKLPENFRKTSGLPPVWRSHDRCGAQVNLEVGLVLAIFARDVLLLTQCLSSSTQISAPGVV